MKDPRKSRLADFDRRSKLDPGGFHQEVDLGCYVAVNPTADDDELLQTLGLSKADCTKVDCYWQFEGDVYFLQVHTLASALRGNGLWARTSPGDPPFVNLVAVVEEPVVTREAVHGVMHRFAASTFRSTVFGETLTRIGDP
jgi:hypothetical protein